MSDIQKTGDGHTPGPWHVIENDGAYVKANDLARFRIETAPESGRDLCLALVITDTSELNNEANARFIVRACNAHDDLVAALKAAYGAINDAFGQANAEQQGLDNLASKYDDKISAFRAKARAAIAKAEGR